MGDPVVDCISELLLQIPEMPVPKFMCLDRVNASLGCDCDGYDHPVSYVDPESYVESTHGGPLLTHYLAVS